MLPVCLARVARSVRAPALRAGVRTSSAAMLPRMRPLARPPAPRDAAERSEDEATVAQSAQAERVPWFMEEEVVDEPEAAQNEDAPRSADTDAPSIAWVPSYLPASSDPPEAIAGLLDLLLVGPLAGLIARPAAHDEYDPQDWGDSTRASPVAVIRPLPSALGDDNPGFQWIVVAQVRGSGAGAVHRVASDVGEYLKHTRPPVADTQEPGLSLDDLLGPAEVIGDAQEAERQQNLPPWQVQKIALSRKFPDGWSPMTRLSREAQDGLRLLHAADPERFSVDVLSRRFRISVESVRRILKSRWQPSAKAVERQNRRAKLMEASRHSTSAATAVREQLELAALRSSSSCGTVPIEQAPRSAGSSPARDPSYEHPVRFEGLVTSSDLAAGRQRQKSIASRGSGDWCLVDAGWCIVHVMTRDARERFRIEDLWRDNGTDSFRAAPPSGARS